MTRLRLDEALVRRGLARSRSRARALIIAGRVRVDGEAATKAGTAVDPDAPLEVVEESPYASRGGDKLEAALQACAVDPAGRGCLDVGASTGGFTDCLLQHGAAWVVAVDVGYGQLDWRVRQHPRVRVLERTNARYLKPSDLPADLPGPPDLMVMDLSFIGVGKVLPAVTSVLAPRAEALILVKPQFEVGPRRVEPGGVVRHPGHRLAAVRSVAEAALPLGWAPVAAVPSPLRGPAGNWECFLHLRRPGVPGSETDVDAVLGQLSVPDDRPSASPARMSQESARP